MARKLPWGPCNPMKETHVDRARHTILVTERNANIRELLRRELDRAGYGVVTAADAPEALEVLRAEPSVDLVVLDEDLPDAKGDGLVEDLLGGTGGPPVILHAFSQGEGAQRAAGRVAAVVEKGGDLERLTAAVARVFADKIRTVPGPRNTRGSDSGG
ncbi:response regulator [Desulfolutivibrio sulfoxidireducens]|nr:response regulator [Desulfolutivibrio sulfoxidireducens]